jgi:DNA-binding MarR family transcriptional regulator
MARVRAKERFETAGNEIGFLLSQIGAHTAGRFAEGLEPLGLKPAHAGIIRVLAESDGLTQQALGEKLLVFPSRLVGLLDELEKKGIVERRDNPSDRRSYALFLSPTGREARARIARIALSLQDALCAELSAAERAQLESLLMRIATAQGLTPGVHPAMRKLNANDRG